MSGEVRTSIVVDGQVKIVFTGKDINGLMHLIENYTDIDAMVDEAESDRLFAVGSGLQKLQAGWLEVNR